MNTNLMFSCKSDNWSTPQFLFDKLNKFYNFDLDVCATDDNKKCDLYYTKEDNGLNQTWIGNVWCNPPYGKTISQWVKKCADHPILTPSKVAVCLVPVRSDTHWWAKYAMQAKQIIFIKGRLKFGDHKNSAPFPSALLVFSSELDLFFPKDFKPPAMTYWQNTICWDVKTPFEEKKEFHFDRLIREILDRDDKVHFFPHLYDKQWYVSVKNKNITYWITPLHSFQDCVDECRILNRRYNTYDLPDENYGGDK